MDLIPRYLQAVKFWLPKKQQDDIIAELSEDIRAQIAEREAALGHPLTEADVEALLRQRGSPIAVANGYLPQQSLIGPQLFPIYRFVLKIVALCILVPSAVVWLFAIVNAALGMPSHRWLAVNVGGLWTTIFASLGMVTLIFAILERSSVKTDLFEKWNPRKLPALRNPHAIPRSSSVIEIAVNLCFLAWWASTMASPFNFHLGNVTLSLTPAWTWFFWAVLLLAAASAAVAIVNLLRPYWTPGRVVARLCLDVAGGVFFCSLLKANIVAAIDWPSATPDKAAFLVGSINHWLAIGFPYALVVCALIAGANVWRLIHLLRKSTAQPMRAAMV
jgi:hypothetical protein